MRDIDDYLRLISRRGDREGRCGGLLDLLDWCDKMALKDVTEAEARCFWEDPKQPYCCCVTHKGES